MKKVAITLFITQFTFGLLLCQSYSPGILRVTVKDNSAIPSVGIQTPNHDLNRIFTKYRIISYKQAMPWSTHPDLRKIYYIEFEDDAIDGLKTELSSLDLFRFIEKEPIPIPTYDPSDHMWQIGWLWHLRNYEADLAWDLTHGGDPITIAIIDSRFDIAHPDLADKFILNYDPYTSIPHTTYQYVPGHNDNHGTFVSSCAIAETDGGGQLASVGFDTRFYAYTWGNSITKAHHASFVLGVDIISISFFYGCTGNYNDSIAILDILNNGTTIVSAAGNGLAGSSCLGSGGQQWGPLYPFSPAYDERVICVTSIGEDNNHYFWDDLQNPPQERTHSHYPEVDICAPGYRVMGARPSLNNSWPYYGGGVGTSFATPQVAGIAALMLSVNQNLTVNQVQDIIRSTADPVNDDNSYPGLIGAGKVNAYKAVLKARPEVYKVPPYSTGFENGFDEHWDVSKSAVYGRVIVNESYGPHTGDKHLTMDVSRNGNYNTNEAWMHLNLSGMSDVELEFWWKETSDETHTADGVFISDDGGDSFTKIYNLSGGSSTYSKVSIDLSDEISSASLTHSSTFVVKFQQYDNYTMSTDGIAIDDINVCAKPTQPFLILGPFEHCAGDWEEYYCTAVTGASEYDWDSPDAIISEDGTRYVDVRAWDEDYYTLKVQATNVCGQNSDWTSTSIWIEDCYGKASEGDDMFILHPNPANDYVTVSLNKDKLSESDIAEHGFTVTVFNQYGTQVISEETKGDSIRISTGQLPNGSYIFRITYQGKIYSYEVIVQH